MTRFVFRFFLILFPVCAVFLLTARPAGGMSQKDLSHTVTRPEYDGTGKLQLPDGYQQWVSVGVSLGLSYSEGVPSHEMFHTTLMEPSAYRHFKRTGEFADGTMLVLVLQGTGEGVLPGRRGRFASELHGVEMAVKDKTRFEEGWAYYGFGGMSGIRGDADAFPKESCYNCHAQHAARDNVFTQFYPALQTDHVLAESGPAGESVAQQAAPVQAEEPTVQETSPVAVSGLDPVMLLEGREEIGKPEIVDDFNGLRYQFASEPNRQRFASDPAAYAIQNDTCPVVPGATLDPAIFLVHEGRIYAFATQDCREEFKARPDQYLPE